MNPTLHWLPGVHAGCFYAAEALLHGQTLADPNLAVALTPPTESLHLALREDHVPAETFFRHLVPLAAGSSGTHDLAEVALVKTIGRTEVEPRLARFQGLLADVKIAYEKALPGLEDLLTRRTRELVRQWNYRGVGILTGVANGAEPGVLPEEATVVVVHPARGGGGAAYPAHRTACIEAVPGDPVPWLPEVVRLAWLLAQLNLAVPRYVEAVRRDRLPLVAPLALVPVVLTAAEAPELARCDGQTLGDAVRAWVGPAEEDAEARTRVLQEWWDVYRTMRPAWPTALQALDRLLVRDQETSKAPDVACT
jgi:hypothetical protein